MMRRLTIHLTDEILNGLAEAEEGFLELTEGDLPVEDIITSRGYTTTTTVDSMVNKTMEYMYTIDAMKKGGKLI